MNKFVSYDFDLDIEKCASQSFIVLINQFSPIDFENIP